MLSFKKQLTFLSTVMFLRFSHFITVLASFWVSSYGLFSSFWLFPFGIKMIIKVLYTTHPYTTLSHSLIVSSGCSFRETSRWPLALSLFLIGDKPITETLNFSWGMGYADWFKSQVTPGFGGGDKSYPDHLAKNGIGEVS